MVDASFMQTLWNMNPIMSGCELAEGTDLIWFSWVFFLNKTLRNVMRLCFQGFWREVTFSDSSTATWTSVWPSLHQRKEKKSAGERKRKQREQQNILFFYTYKPHVCLLWLWYRLAHYEGGSVCSQARSLWRLEPLRIRWLSFQCRDVMQMSFVKILMSDFYWKVWDNFFLQQKY